MNMGFPDVCLTPAAPTPVPVPYPNLGMNSMAMPFCPNVLISGMPGQNMAAKPLLTNGDNAGVVHPLFMQPGGTIMGNPLIQMNGLPGKNLLCPSYGNNFNNPIGATTIPSISNVFFCALAELAELLEHPAPSPGLSLDAEGRVLQVRRGGAAARLGVRAGDRLLPAPPGRLRLRRAGRRPPLDLIPSSWGAAPTLTVRRRGEAAWLVLRRLGPAAPRLLEAACRRLARRGCRRLVLDLRGNPGGTLAAAVDAAGLFLPLRSPVTTLRTAGGSWTCRTRQPHPDLTTPLDVVVDRGTASAAEVLAAALTQTGRARLRGAPSHGKLRGATPAGLTADLLPPAGVDLNGVGLCPATARPSR